MVLIQPRNLSSNQSIDIGLQRSDDFINLVQTSYAKTEAAYKQMSEDMDKVVTNKEFMFDTKGLVQDTKDRTSHREQKYKLYNGLGQYTKATIQFVKSRIGYYKIDSSGNYLQFVRPVDQNYYNQLISGIGLYSKQIDQLNADDMNIIRNQVGIAENMIAHAKK